MLTRLFRFISTLSLLVWLGLLISLSFFVAPSLFSNESGQVEHSGVAAAIIGPLLHRMNVMGWVLIPIAAAAQALAWLSGNRRGFKALIASLVLLLVAWGASLYSGTVVTDSMQDIRVALAEEYGGYHLAPDDDPARQRFGMLHGVSMSVAMLNLLLGVSSLFLSTEIIGAPTRRD